MPNEHNCKEVHRLTSEGMDRELSPSELSALRHHMLACAACRDFEGQLRLLRQAMRRMAPGGERGE